MNQGTLFQPIIKICMCLQPFFYNLSSMKYSSYAANKLMIVWEFVFIYYIKKSIADIAKSNNQKVRIEVV